MKKIAVVMPWPGIKNAEFEAIERIKIAAENVKLDLVVIDNNGNILDNKQELTRETIEGKDIEFVLSMHYETPKFLDTFYYNILWNPPSYIIANIERDAVKNMSTNDAFLCYNSKGIIEHANMMLESFKGKLYRDFDFVASPHDIKYKPNLSDPKMFYCGINWEKTLNKPGRHDLIFKELDKTGNLKIFGPERFLNARPWEGFKCYCGEIPFDGVSLLKEINKCGIALVLSSDNHRKCQAVTSKLYEAIAGGAVVIAENNEFIKQEFGDAVLYIEYKIGDQKNVSKQIMKHYNWIKNNPEKAIKLAEKLQTIFRKKFAMTKQLKTLVKEHKNIKKKAEKETFAKNQKEKIDIVLQWIKDDLEKLDKTINYINNQSYKNLNLIALFDTELHKKAKKFLDKNLRKSISFKIFPLEIYNRNLKKGEHGYQVLTNGEILSIALRKTKNKLITFIENRTIWFSDHITTLKKTFEDNPDKEIAHSGIFLQTKNRRNYRKHKVINYHEFFIESLKNFDERLNISCLMIKKTALKKHNLDTFKFSNGLESFIFLLKGLKDKTLKYSNRMTCGLIETSKSEYNNYNKIHESRMYISSLFSDDFYFEKIARHMNDCSTEHALKEFQKKFIIMIRNSLLKKRLISRFLFKIFIGKKNWKNRI